MSEQRMVAVPEEVLEEVVHSLRFSEPGGNLSATEASRQQVKGALAGRLEKLMAEPESGEEG